MTTANSNAAIYWIRYQYESQGHKLTDVVEFPTQEMANLGLARLHVYAGTDYLLVSSGERPWPAGYKTQEPRSWHAFLKALERGLDRTRVVKGPIERQVEPKTIAGECLKAVVFFGLLCIIGAAVKAVL